MNDTDRNSGTYRSQYPELYQFFAGYFYQGWASDYRWDGSEPSFRAVVRHFRAVNPPIVVEAARGQLDQLISIHAGDVERLGKALFDLGNGYDPSSEGLSISDWTEKVAEVMSESAASSMILRERY